MAGQNIQSVSKCQQQCYQTYLRLYQYYCRWGTICRYTNYLAQFYMACYKNCSEYHHTQSHLPCGVGRKVVQLCVRVCVCVSVSVRACVRA